MNKKKKDPNKCDKCGWRIVLASVYIAYLEVEPDAEPYESEVVEPVIVHGEEKETIEISFYMSCHACPACGWVRDLEMTSRE